MPSFDEEAISWLLNSGRIPLALDEGLRSLIEDYFFEGDDDLPRGKFFIHVDRKLLQMNLLIMVINNTRV